MLVQTTAAGDFRRSSAGIPGSMSVDPSRLSASHETGSTGSTGATPSILGVAAFPSIAEVVCVSRNQASTGATFSRPRDPTSPQRCNAVGRWLAIVSHAGPRAR
jgi:hypothetical protein